MWILFQHNIINTRKPHRISLVVVFIYFGKKEEKKERRDHRYTSVLKTPFGRVSGPLKTCPGIIMIQKFVLTCAPRSFRFVFAGSLHAINKIYVYRAVTKISHTKHCIKRDVKTDKILKILPPDRIIVAFYGFFLCSSVVSSILYLNKANEMFCSSSLRV